MYLSSTVFSLSGVRADILIDRSMGTSVDWRICLSIVIKPGTSEGFTGRPVGTSIVKECFGPAYAMRECFFPDRRRARSSSAGAGGWLNTVRLVRRAKSAGMSFIRQGMDFFHI